MTDLMANFRNMLSKHAYNANIQQHYLINKFEYSQERTASFSRFLGRDLYNVLNNLSVEAIQEIDEAEKLIHSINEGTPHLIKRDSAEIGRNVVEFSGRSGRDQRSREEILDQRTIQNGHHEERTQSC